MGRAARRITIWMMGSAKAALTIPCTFQPYLILPQIDTWDVH
jgi:hypothetical protein